MNCPTCGVALTLAPGASIARCGSCQGYSGVVNGAAMALAVMAPWPTRTKDDLEDEADDQAFETQAAAPNPTGKILRIAIPAVVILVMIIVAITVITSTMASQASPTAQPTAAPTPIKGQPAAPVKKK